MIPNPSFCLFFTWFWGLCYGFVLLSSATGAGGFPQENTLKPGSAWLYDLRTSVLLNEKGGTTKDVGFLITAQVLVESVWGNSKLDRLFKIELLSPQLHIRSRKAPAPDGFVVHTSKLDSLIQSPFLVEWSSGRINKIHLKKDETVSIANLKKGIASLFQFQTLDQQVMETDSSGKCEAEYYSVSSNAFRKTKFSCTSVDLPYLANPELLLSTKIDSSRIGEYVMDDDNSYIKSIHFSEKHIMFTVAKEDIGNKIETQQILSLVKEKHANIIDSETFDDAINQISNKEGVTFTQESLLTEKEALPSEEAITFTKIIKENRDNLKNKLVGSLASAKILPKIIGVGRITTKSDIVKALEVKKNQAILHQLYDILGYVQTKASHEAAMKNLQLDDKDKEDLTERYLWALSTSSQPNPYIIEDLLSRYRKTSHLSPKVKETLLSSIASMADRLSKLPVFTSNEKLYQNVEDALLHGLDSAKGDDRLLFLRALKNFQSKKITSKLLKVAKKGTIKEQVLAWKAIRSFDKSYWNKEVLKAAFNTFYQLHKKQDSSSRTIALDVIIELDPSDETLRSMFHFLMSDPKAYEIQQYLVQRLTMIAQNCNDFRNRIQQIVINDNKLNNYAFLAQRGLSTALMRPFLQNPSSNGSLVTIQEMQNGIVKRGVVNVVMSKNDISHEIFSLGIFSGGLSSFVSSDTEATDSDEPATAGIELAVLGTKIRPFVFFNGQGELMGHVWSGTASEKTTAYRALAMLHDHLEYLRLGSGFIAELDVKGGISFDLSGQIETSLWNRNAVSLVEKSAGIAVLGFMKVDTSFVRSQVEFSVAVEPKLNLNTDLDFSSAVSLCMKLSQPDLSFRHNIFKIERIPGSKHRLRKVKYRKYIMPGKTYSLNKKNNEMCNVIFNK